jgi:putative PIN family toxin of toxin-antitoxin system
LQWLRQSWRRGEIVPVVNRLTTLELLRVLTYPKFRLSQSEQEDILAEYLPYCEVAAALDSVPVPHIRDAADKVFVQLALATKVAYLVTGDNDLLVLATVLSPGSVQIVTPDQLHT